MTPPVNHYGQHDPPSCMTVDHLRQFRQAAAIIFSSGTSMNPTRSIATLFCALMLGA